MDFTAAAAISVVRRPRAAAATADSSSGAAARGNPRILIVEDDFLVATELEYQLSQAGFDVVGVATTAEDAIALAEEHEPSLAVMDVRLAGNRDGVDAAIQLFRNFGIRSIFATAHADGETVARAKSASPLAWLQKPYSSASLITAIKAALSN
jgi:DNA-binding NarL/FixJ family response regulator